MGGSSFALSAAFGEVTGIDYSEAFIEACARLQQDGSHPYRALVSGETYEDCVARVPPASAGSTAKVDAARCKFVVGDACDLDACPLVKDRVFDCVLGANLLCRLPDPSAFLRRQRQLIAPGGILVLVSPYSWLEEYTAKDRWLGGTLGEPDSAAAVANFLRPHFELLYEEQMPFLIREHVRKFAWAVSSCSVWRRKDDMEPVSH
eukprot:SAG31_NODE_572_length_13974_cov_28.935640_8_plen_205_part_00